MSNTLTIYTQKVTNMSDNSVHYQHEVSDDNDEVTIYIGSGKEGEKIAKAALRAGPDEIIKKVYKDGGQNGGANDMLTDHCSNERGCRVNDVWIEPEELIEILRKCREDE